MFFRVRHNTLFYAKRLLFAPQLLLINQSYPIYRDLHGRGDLRKFIDHVGSDPKDMKFWFRVFQHQDVHPEKPFAVMHINSNVFNSLESLKRLVESVNFLHQNGLMAVLVVGSENIEQEMKMTENTICLTELLERSGSRTRPFLSSAGLVSQLSQCEKLGKSNINIKPIVWSLSSNTIPIISTFYHDAFGNEVFIPSIDMVDQLSLILQPLKVIYLNSEGGVYDPRNEKILSNLSFPNDDELLNSYAPDKRDRLWKISELLKRLPYTSSAVITSPDTLLRELFTHGGAGTMLKHFEALKIAKSLNELDVEKLIDLLETSFNRHLRKSYVTSLEKRLCGAYVTASYSAAAIITKEPSVNDVPYLCKFAVLPQNQGLGAGESLWHDITRDVPSLFWRSRNRNKINPWYFARAEGSWCSSEYTTFWYGIQDPRLSYDIITYSTKLESSFIEQIQQSSPSSS